MSTRTGPAVGLFGAPVAEPGRRWFLVASAATATAGVGHVLAALDHLGHGLLYAIFFLAVGCVQMLVSGRLRRGASAIAVTAVLAGTVALVLLYVHSRTVGLDLGPHSDRPEDPDPLGTAVVAAELVATAALPALLPSRWRPVAVNALLLVGSAVWIAWFAGLLA